MKTIFIANYWKISLSNIIVVYYVCTYDRLSKPGAMHQNYCLTSIHQKLSIFTSLSIYKFSYISISQGDAEEKSENVKSYCTNFEFYLF